MTKKAGRKYGQVGENLRSVLAYRKFKHPGKLAAFLLDAFVYERGRIKAERAVAEGFCGEGEFRSKFQEKLIREGLVTWHHDDGAYHKCGPTLLKYLNLAKALVEEMASRIEVEEVEVEVASLKDDFKRLEAKVQSHEEKLEWIIELLDPPSDEEKIRSFPSPKIKAKLKLLEGQFTDQELFPAQRET